MVALALPLPAQEDALRQSMDVQTAAERDAQASQARIDALDDETRELLTQWRAALREAETLERYNEQLARLTASQQEEIARQREVLAGISETNQRIYPHLEDLLATLETFQSLDLPFLPDERGRRLQALREMMDRADVSVAEKYRRLMEAYAVELEYGRTIEAYEATLGAHGYAASDTSRSVALLRVGRLALLYQTRDGSETGYWDRRTGSFVTDNAYADAVTRGLRVARRQTAPELLRVPVPAPEAP